MKDFRPMRLIYRGTAACLFRLAGVVACLMVLTSAVAVGAEPDHVDFNRDIRPILSERCFKCHGPDENTREASLRLDIVSGATLEADSGETAVVPNHPQQSELLKRVTSEDADLRMPPKGEGEPLTPAEIELFRRWIKQGAPYPKHWSFVPPIRPELPNSPLSDWVRNPIDHFVMKNLRKEDLKPSPEANRRTLIRRLSLDLLGLPPMIEEVDSFLQDTKPGAYERLVDRMLASPHYGERMAQDWLDLARYSDTTGFAADSPRPMWLYRDWVLKALNDNMPFDQFTIEQLAGDMLPQATDSQKIATGFHRNSMQALGNNPPKEEFRVKGIIDRVNTTGRVWLGLTLSCAECHDHKFDPISQKDYYSLYAIFNNIPHYGKNFGVRGPRIDAISPLADQQQKQTLQELADLRQAYPKSSEAEIAQRQARWERNMSVVLGTSNDSDSPGEADRLVAHWPLAENLDERSAEPLVAKLPEGSAKWSPQKNIHDRSGLHLTSKQYLRIADPEKLDTVGDLTITAWIKTSSKKADIVCKYDSERNARAFVFGIGGEGEQNAKPGNLYAWVTSTSDRFNGVQIYGTIPVNDNRWHHVALVLRAGKSVDLYVDGRLDVLARRSGDVPEKIANSDCDLLLGAGYGLAAGKKSYFFEGLLNDVRIYRAALPDAASLGRLSPWVLDTLALPESDRSDEQRTNLAKYFRSYDDGNLPAIIRKRIGYLEQNLKTIERPAQAQVMLEMDQPRATHVHIRGNFQEKGRQVSPSLPEFLPSLPESVATNRLSFARWLVQKDHPLTARVAVNRFWQHYFGSGLVRTSDNFGVQGEWPTHGELLDYLAVEFVEGGWDMKAIHRLIVTSATYRQSSAAGEEAYARDPLNRHLARGARFRLSAEQVRDNALAISGLLYDKLGGPSIYPYQPPGILEEKGQLQYHPVWITSTDPLRHRRGIYVYWKRMNLYPSFSAFGAPTRERCTGMRAKTNTPIQALVVLNDTVYFDMAREFAKLILHHGGDSPESRLDYAMKRCLARDATPKELKFILAYLDKQVDHYRQAPDAAVQVTLAPPGPETAELAAWTWLASALLNLDETITKQ